jgi:prevent-host-death family protein
MKISISEVKANLSKYVNLAYHGERIVVLKNNIPLVDIVPHQVEGKRTLGLLAGQFTVPENFLDEDDQINSMFYGDDR